jgi:K+-transporting ATPase KdpF subunit
MAGVEISKMTADLILGAISALGIGGYMLAALIYPEKF